MVAPTWDDTWITSLVQKLMNHCRPEKKDTKEHGQMLNIILKVGMLTGWKS